MSCFGIVGGYYMRIKHGEVFAFYIEQTNKYGIIQVLHRGETGYHVRVFYNMVDDLEQKTIDSIVRTTDFYYLKNFFKFDLTRTGKKLGCFTVPEFVVLPKYMRTYEIKPNGEFRWYVMDDLQVVKTYKTFDETLKPLSPATSWGIQYVKKRWIEGFTLENWNELAKKWYQEYLRTYEPHKIVNASKETILNSLKNTERISEEVLNNLNQLLSNFAKHIQKYAKDSSKVNISIKELIEELNTMNLRYQFIETEERESIIEYIYGVLEIYHCDDTYDTVLKLL